VTTTDAIAREDLSMTEPTAGDDDAKVEDTETAATAGTTADDAAPTDSSPAPPHWSKNRGLWVAVVLVALLLGGGVFGFINIGR
jgi:Mce-associated membrane protein